MNECIFDSKLHQEKCARNETRSRYLRQVFLAGTRKIVDQAQRLRQHSRPTKDQAQYFTMEKFVKYLENETAAAAGGQPAFERTKFVSWTEFKSKFWNTRSKRSSSHKKGKMRGGKGTGDDAQVGKKKDRPDERRFLLALALQHHL